VIVIVPVGASQVGTSDSTCPSILHGGDPKASKAIGSEALGSALRRGVDRYEENNAHMS
jgi:hypothetical protein